MARRKPTAEAYGDLQKAYDFYNRRLFEGKLPACLITLQRKRGAYGYFSADRWQSGRAKSDEIALNPDHIAKDTVKEVLSTLVHEMVHLWQHHFGKPGRGRYHNREWAGQMLEIGLHPSSTGEPGGAMTGDQMSDYVVKNGPFDVVTRELLGTGFKIKWLDRFAVPATKGGGTKKPPTGPRYTRQKFTCRKCGQNAWAKYEAKLMCGACKKLMKPVGLV